MKTLGEVKDGPGIRRPLYTEQITGMGDKGIEGKLLRSMAKIPSGTAKTEEVCTSADSRGGTARVTDFDRVLIDCQGYLTREPTERRENRNQDRCKLEGYTWGRA